MPSEESLAKRKAYQAAYYKRPDVRARYRLKWASDPDFRQRAKEYSQSKAGRRVRRKYLRTHKEQIRLRRPKRVNTWHKRKRLSDPEWSKRQRINAKASYRKRVENGKNKQYWRNKYRTNLPYRISNLVSRSIRQALTRGNGKKLKRTTQLIGCSIQEFRTHLESQFSEGMSWKNMGSWEIDHRVPLSSFNLADPEQQKLAFNLHNCRPMWKPANRQKSDKIDGELFRGRDYRKLNIIPFKAA